MKGEMFVMNNEYTPIEINDIFPDFNMEELKKYLASERQPQRPKIATIDFLISEFSLSPEAVKNKDVFLRNYIYSMVVARKHLLEIDARLNQIIQNQSRIKEKESYSLRKLKYFEKKNKEAKDQIVDFICYRLVEYITARNDHYADLIERHNEENMWLIGPTYDYQYNAKYYDPDYDFSTFAKFYNIPNVPLIERLKNTEEMILLRERSLEEYQSKVIDTVRNNSLMSQIVERVNNNYHIHHRKEIFDSLLELFNDEKYLAFVVGATIQLEGMFYELVSIKYGDKENQGTLVEKVERSFKQHQVLKHTLYPYFAFDIPDLRNQVAHKGIVENDNIEVLAYELILDINCIVALIEKESIDKFKYILVIRDSLHEVDSQYHEINSDYYKAISQRLFYELYMGNMMSPEFFWELITAPEDYEDELNYYVPEDIGKDECSLKDIVFSISALFKRNEFWTVVLEECKKVSAIDETKVNDLGAFIEKLKNMFISRLDGEAKELCCQVSAELQKS